VRRMLGLVVVLASLVLAWTSVYRPPGARLCCGLSSAWMAGDVPQAAFALDEQGQGPQGR